jgi:hypothetical protein
VAEVAVARATAAAEVGLPPAVPAATPVIRRVGRQLGKRVVERQARRPVRLLARRAALQMVRAAPMPTAVQHQAVDNQLAAAHRAVALREAACRRGAWPVAELRAAGQRQVVARADNRALPWGPACRAWGRLKRTTCRNESHSNS